MFTMSAISRIAGTGMMLIAWVDSAQAGSPEFSLDSWILDPDVSVDMEGLYSPQYSTPYVILTDRNGDKDPIALSWPEVREMVETGQYGPYEPQLIIKACEKFKEAGPELEANNSFLNIGTDGMPPATFPCTNLNFTS